MTTASATPPEGEPPPPAVDLEPFGGKSDREVALLLGARRDRVWFYIDDIAQERSGYNDRALQGRPRCEAGKQTKLRLRCVHPALTGERWCQPHHPTPPYVEPKSSRARKTLGVVTDGELAVALDELSGDVSALCTAMDRMAAALEALEAQAEVARPRPPLLTLSEVAERLRLSEAHVYRLVSQMRIPAIRVGRFWRFDPGAVDAWLAKRARRVVQ
jgi:excisionase family DNA binding protein